MHITLRPNNESEPVEYTLLQLAGQMNSYSAREVLYTAIEYRCESYLISEIKSHFNYPLYTRGAFVYPTVAEVESYILSRREDLLSMITPEDDDDSEDEEDDDYDSDDDWDDEDDDDWDEDDDEDDCDPRTIWLN